MGSPRLSCTGERRRGFAHAAPRCASTVATSARPVGGTKCRGFSAARGKDIGYAEERVVHWPVVTGEVVADFSQHNVAAKDGGFGMKIVRADARSYTGCSAAYATGV